MEIEVDAVLAPGPYLYWIDDDGEWGTHFEGIICMSLTEKQIDKLAIKGFDSDDIDLPEVLEVNINGIILNFFPYQYLY